MGDELVDAVANDLSDLAFANGIAHNKIRPIVDAIVNQLREHGMADDEIKAALVQPEAF